MWNNKKLKKEEKKKKTSAAFLERSGNEWPLLDATGKSASGSSKAGQGN